jgi:hypothetical protein
LVDAMVGDDSEAGARKGVAERRRRRAEIAVDEAERDRRNVGNAWHRASKRVW